MTDWERQHLDEDQASAADALREHRVDANLDDILARAKTRAIASARIAPTSDRTVPRRRTVLTPVLVLVFVMSAGTATLAMTGQFSSKREGSAAKHQYQPPGCDRASGKKKGCDPKPCKGKSRRSYGKGRKCKVRGTGGNDRLHGSSHTDSINAGRGNDYIIVRGLGRDHVRCGPGRDTVVADRHDRVSKDCERVIRR